MAYLTNDAVLRSFVTEILNTGATSKRYTGGTLVSLPASLLDPNDHLIYQRRSGQKSTEWGPVTMCRYLADRKTFLVNGDGFTDTSATNWQTALRNLLTREMQIRSNGHNTEWQVLLVPFAAMGGAEIQMNTVRPIHIREDTWDVIWHSVPTPEQISFEQLGKWKLTNQTSRLRTYEQTIKGVRFRTNLQHDTWRKEWRWNSRYEVMGATIDQPEPGWRRINQYELTRATRRFVDGYGIARTDMSFLAQHPNLLNENGEQLTEEERSGWGWTEEVHHLGASVFSAVGEDGKRHKFVSGFDDEEPQQLYYLAQLPDRSGVTTYEEAIEALAPPIVKKARDEGKLVYRQGDIFAIRTDLSSQKVYANARTRVRRSVAMFDLSNGLRNQIQNVRRGGDTYELPQPGDKEVSEWIDCPCRCGHRRKVGCGPKARNALSIYGTGHTANEVVVTRKGATFIRGTMYHDPQIHQAGRRAEHRPVPLGSNPKVWFLAVRNTVPRRKRRIVQGETDNNGRR